MTKQTIIRFTRDGAVTYIECENAQELQAAIDSIHGSASIDAYRVYDLDAAFTKQVHWAQEP
jgi:hypothetical protein